MSSKRQLSFAAGVISPEYFGRQDQVRNQTGCATLRNFHVMKSGGIQNRAGTLYKGACFQPTLGVRLRTWRFNDSQTYLLELSNLRMSFWQSGSPVLETGLSIQTSITQASPCVVHCTGHGFSVGDKVKLTAIGGMTELNNRYYKVRTVPSADTFSLSYCGDGTADGTAVDSTAFTAYTSGGLASRVYSITTPYVTADLSTLQFAQSAGTMVIVHPSYAPRKLTRTASTSWTLATPTYGPGTSYPTGGSASAGGAGALTIRYMVTSESESTGIESLSGTAHTKTISAITLANPGVVTTSTNHGYATGDEVVMETISGMTELSNRRFKIEVTAVDKFKLVGENTTSYSAFTSGVVYLAHINLLTAADPTTAAPHTVTLNASSVAGVRYNVYKELGGIYGFIGSTYALTFSDTGIIPDTLTSVPIYREPFQGSSNYPSAVTFYQQRLVMGGSTNLPNGADAGCVGDNFNFTIHSPHEDTDAVRFTTAGYVDAVRHMGALDKLIVFTSGAEWVVNGGGEGGTLTPTEINAQPRSFNGSGDLFPLLIDSNVIYKQERGQIIRDFFYSLKDNGYTGKNLGQFSDHLFKGHTVDDWAFQRSPHGIVWVARDDGQLLSMTYQPEHEFYGWATHDLEGGSVEQVCVVPEGSEDTAEDMVYLVVARTLEDGSTSRYIECIATRTYSDIKDAVFVDSGLAYDGRNTGSTTMTLTGSGWTNATSLTLTASASFFTAADVGNEIQMNGLDADGVATQIRCRITAYSGVTIVTVIPHATVPVPMRAVAITDWARAVDTFGGLWHLEGETVSMFGDGVVVASALNPAYETQYTVTDGEFTLEGDQRYAVAVVGMPITADLLTLDIDPAEDGKFMTRTKLVKAVGVRVAESRSFYAGARQPDDDDDDPIQYLYEPKIREDETYNETMALTTGVLKVRTQARWNRGGRVFLRILEPAPVSVLGVSSIGSIYE